MPAVASLRVPLWHPGSTNVPQPSFDVRGRAGCGIQWTMFSGLPGATVVEYMGSLNTVNWFSLEFQKVLAAPGHSGLIECAAYDYITPIVTTPSGIAGSVGLFTIDAP